MSMTKDQILAEAMKLEPAGRGQLANAFWRVAHGISREQIDAEWAAEIRRRIDALDRGEASSKLSDEVVERLRKKVS